MDSKSQKTKLKLKNEKNYEPEHRCMTNYSNYFYNNGNEIDNNQNYQKLL